MEQFFLQILVVTWKIEIFVSETRFGTRFLMKKAPVLNKIFIWKKEGLHDIFVEKRVKQKQKM